MKAAQKAEDHMINEYAHQGWKMLNTKKGGALGSAREPKYKLAELIEEAKKYKKRSEFERACPAKYAFADAHGLLDIVCAHMPKHYYPTATIWTKERLDTIVEECGYSRQAVKEQYPKAMQAIWHKDLTKHYFGSKRICKNRTLEDTIRECAKYESVSELKKSDKTLYEYVVHKSWADVCFKHLKGRKIKKIDRESLTWEEVKSKILLCSTLKEMRINHTPEYRTALKHEDWRKEMLRLLPRRNKTTLEEIRKVCLRYRTPTELQRSNLRVYNIVMRERLQNECFAHMKAYRPHRGPYTWEEIFSKIKLCSKLTEFREKYNCMYHAARRNPDWKKKLYKYLPRNKKSSNAQ